MPSSHGRQKRAAKQKKRREARRKARPQRGAGASAAARRAAAARARSPKVEPLSDAQFAELGYDAEREPPNDWATIDEQERLSRVARYHEAALPPEAQPPQPSSHAGLHVIVELQLQDQRPPEARAALGRLQTEGLSRHDAIHAIGWLAAEHMRKAMGAGTPVDEGAYARDLGKLTRDEWLAMVVRSATR